MIIIALIGLIRFTSFYVAGNLCEGLHGLHCWVFHPETK